MNHSHDANTSVKEINYVRIMNKNNHIKMRVNLPKKIILYSRQLNKTVCVTQVEDSDEQRQWNYPRKHRVSTSKAWTWMAN